MPLKDPEKRRAYQKARRAIYRERDAMRYATDPAFRARKIASAKKYYKENRKKREKVKRKWDEANRDKRREYMKKSMRKIRLAYCFDSDLYAKARAYNRMQKAKRIILTGGVYSPRFSCRIPDFAVKGQDLVDHRSQFLSDNITEEQVAFAKELYRERNAK